MSMLLLVVLLSLVALGVLVVGGVLLAVLLSRRHR